MKSIILVVLSLQMSSAHASGLFGFFGSKAPEAPKAAPISDEEWNRISTDLRALGASMRAQWKRDCQSVYNDMEMDRYKTESSHGSSCLMSLSSIDREAMAKSVVDVCVENLRSELTDKSLTPEKILVNLKSAFNDAYGKLYRVQCLDREVKAFQTNTAPSVPEVPGAAAAGK